MAENAPTDLCFASPEETRQQQKKREEAYTRLHALQRGGHTVTIKFPHPHGQFYLRLPKQFPPPASDLLYMPDGVHGRYVGRPKMNPFYHLVALPKACVDDAIRSRGLSECRREDPQGM